MTETTAKPINAAVIDIGATSIRMALAEFQPDGAVRHLDDLSRPVSVGRDTFTRNSIRRSTIEDAARVLKSYRRVLNEYHIDDQQLRVVATSAVREASNRLAFLDRVFIATGMEVDVLEEAEANRITYMSVLPHLRSEPDLAEAPSVVVEIGGGSTELLLLRGQNVVYSHTYRLGSLRLRRMLQAFQAPQSKERELIERQIHRTVEEIRLQAMSDESTRMIALGGDLRFATRHLLPDWEPGALARISVESVEQFADEVLSQTEDELAQRYHLSFPNAESLGLALLANVRLAQSLGISELLVSNANLRDGLLQEMAAKEQWSENFVRQINRSAVDLAAKFQADLPHARHVAEISGRLFDQLQERHQLERRYKVMLQVAALLHEIGLFISVRANHKHTMYLIRNSELFGLGRRSILLTSLVARYHRRASPQPDHEGYSNLPRDQRVAVLKLAALLRVAIAMDETRSQRIGEFSCKATDRQLVISIPHVRDLSLEQLALRQSGSLFEEVFGLPVLLRHQPS